MKYIFKYPIMPDDQQTVLMPDGAVILTVQCQHDFPCIWALVDDTKPGKLRKIAMVGTGRPCDHLESAAYIGTFQIRGGTLVFHVFDETEASS